MKKKIISNSISKKNINIICGATEIGEKHILSREKNQDAVKVKRYGFGCVMTLADGVGSHKFSRFGSRAIVQSVHRTFIDFVKGKVEEDSLTCNINNHFKKCVPMKYLSQAATTCIFAAYIYQTGLFLGQIGDGICIYSIDGNDFILKGKENAFTNIVTPFNAASEDNKWNVMFIPERMIKQDLDVLLLTDGLSEDILQGKEFDFLKKLKMEIVGKTNKKASDVIKKLIKTWPVPMSSDDKSLCYLHM